MEIYIRPYKGQKRISDLGYNCLKCSELDMNLYDPEICNLKGYLSVYRYGDGKNQKFLVHNRLKKIKHKYGGLTITGIHKMVACVNAIVLY